MEGGRSDSQKVTCKTHVTVSPRINKYYRKKKERKFKTVNSSL